jgi:hypothetical protein
MSASKKIPKPVHQLKIREALKFISLSVPKLSTLSVALQFGIAETTLHHTISKGIKTPGWSTTLSDYEKRELVGYALYAATQFQVDQHSNEHQYYGKWCSLIHTNINFETTNPHGNGGKVSCCHVNFKDVLNFNCFRRNLDIENNCSVVELCVCLRVTKSFYKGFC